MAYIYDTALTLGLCNRLLRVAAGWRRLRVVRRVMDLDCLALAQALAAAATAVVVTISWASRHLPDSRSETRILSARFVIKTP